MTENTRFEEVEVLEAEVIEESIERIEYTPAIINAETYLAARRKWLEEMMEPYQGMDNAAISTMNVKEAKVCRTDLNRIIKEVDDERKAIKRAYNEPLERFEAAVKELLEPAKSGSEKLKEYIDKNAVIERDKRKQGLEATYNDFAPALVPVVPFDRILEINPKWLNKSYNAGKAAEELEDAVKKIAKDWEVLKRQASLMRFYEESEAVFFRTLDLNAAIAHNDMREEEAQRIQQLKDEVDVNRGAQEIPPVIEQVIEPAPVVGRDIRQPYVIHIRLSAFEKTRLVDFIKAENIGTDRFIGKAKE